MFYKSATVFFVDEPGLIKPSRVLTNSFLARAERFNNALQRYTITPGDKKQYLNTVMICYAFEMSLHLFRRFNFIHIYYYTQHTNILKYVGVFIL